MVTKYFRRLLDQAKQPTHALRTTREPPRYPLDKGEKLLRPDEIIDVRESCKAPEFFEKPPLSRGEEVEFPLFYLSLGNIIISMVEKSIFLSARTEQYRMVENLI